MSPPTKATAAPTRVPAAAPAQPFQTSPAVTVVIQKPSPAAPAIAVALVGSRLGSNLGPSTSPEPAKPSRATPIWIPAKSGMGIPCSPHWASPPRTPPATAPTAAPRRVDFHTCGPGGGGSCSRQFFRKSGTSFSIRSGSRGVNRDQAKPGGRVGWNWIFTKSPLHRDRHTPTVGSSKQNGPNEQHEGREPLANLSTSRPSTAEALQRIHPKVGPERLPVEDARRSKGARQSPIQRQMSGS
jgi:hypothetical protein